jgi:hypothetical protein
MAKSKKVLAEIQSRTAELVEYVTTERYLFREVDHVYYHEKSVEGNLTREKYTSVTTVLSGLKKKFDSEGEAQKYIDKYGDTFLEVIAKKKKLDYAELVDIYGDLPVSKETVLKVWKDINETAKTRGTKYHAKKEKQAYEEGSMPLIEDGEFKVAYDIKKLSTKDSGTTLYAEAILYHPFYKIIGTADEVIFDGLSFKINDWKTNRDGITKPAFKGERLLTPVSHLEANKMNEYALQLSIYAFILEEYGYKCTELNLGFVKDVEKDIVENYPVPYLKAEAKAILTYFKNRGYKL